MGFVCPACATKDALEISLFLELPPDSRSDEITVQLLRCRSCGFPGVSVYEESRRGSLFEEAWDHQAYGLEEEEWRRLARLISVCPNRRDPNCLCSGHLELNRRDGHGAWLGLTGFRLGKPFGMVI
ncbi:MAG: hypothetical protein AB1641_22090 [Thermodesulfobacteriota bacterium]